MFWTLFCFANVRESFFASHHIPKVLGIGIFVNSIFAYCHLHGFLTVRLSTLKVKACLFFFLNPEKFRSVTILFTESFLKKLLFNICCNHVFLVSEPCENICNLEVTMIDCHFDLINCITTKVQSLATRLWVVENLFPHRLMQYIMDDSLCFTIFYLGGNFLSEVLLFLSYCTF